jgi:small subunit ribosomal protein S3
VKFIIGFLGGLVVGAAGAIAYSMQTGRDLREIVDDVRSDLSKRDLDALGARLEGRVSEMQKELEGRIAAIKEKASAAVDEAREVASDTAADAVAEASDAVAEAADAVAEATDAVDPAVEAVAKKASRAKEAAEDQAPA